MNEPRNSVDQDNLQAPSVKRSEWQQPSLRRLNASEAENIINAGNDGPAGVS